jgi:hypothetical protein
MVPPVAVIVVMGRAGTGTGLRKGLFRDDRAGALPLHTKAD